MKMILFSMNVFQTIRKTNYSNSLLSPFSCMKRRSLDRTIFVSNDVFSHEEKIILMFELFSLKRLWTLNEVLVPLGYG